MQSPKISLGHIRVEAEGLDEMVRNLLAITRIEEGALELRLDWIDLREIADRTINAARRRGASQHFETRLPPDLPLGRADATLVEQTLGNIINNAVAHTPAGTRVTIDAEVKNARIKLRVTDDGPGIPPEVLPHVFEKFMRGPRPGSTGADGGQGTGLGLAIAKGIMEAHGGSIAAESPVANGRGTRIVLKAFEGIDLVGWRRADALLSSIVPVLTAALGSEEMDSWRHPVDLVALTERALRDLTETLGTGMTRRASTKALEAVPRALFSPLRGVHACQHPRRQC